MAINFQNRNPLGLALSSAIMPGDQPDFMPHNLPRAPAPQKGGFFREGGMGRTIAGLIGDALLQQADMAPVYAPAIRQQQAMAAEEAQWTRRREAERADKQWEWANKPKEGPTPTEFERALEASGVQRGTPQWTAAMARKVDNTLNPMMAVQTVDASGNPAITYTPRNGIQAPPAASAVPTIADEAGYNALPAGAQYRDPQGQLRTKAGGPTQQGSGSFPSGY